MYPLFVGRCPTLGYEGLSALDNRQSKQPTLYKIHCRLTPTQPLRRAVAYLRNSDPAVALRSTAGLYISSLAGLKFSFNTENKSLK
ncbi:MAG: hypothetical protein LBU34_00060 [Planctomycetaceae bacterium]|jgi:hypothetical protein|nr:hypothetical protein [Planctomycetaceae bacterium]